MAEAATTTFEQLISRGALIVGDGYRAKNDELGGSGLIFLRAGHVTDTHIDFGGAERFTSGNRSLFESKMARPGDVVVTTKGNSTGRIAFVSSDMPEFVYSPHLSFWRCANRGEIDPEFLHAWARGPEFRVQLAGMSASTDMAPYLSLVDQLRLRISLPPIDVQQRVGRILRSLDEKIELNRRMNGTLEAMARALFKSWFVDARTVPRPVADLSEAFSGGTPSKEDRSLWGGSIPWISPKAMTDIHADESDESVTPSAIGNGTRLVPRGATLVMVRGMGLHERVRVSQARREVAFNQDVKALVARPGVEPVLLFFALLDAQEVLLSKVESSGHGTGRMPSDILLSYPLNLPPPGEQSTYAHQLDALSDRIDLNRRESRTLAQLRDALLPKLLSGELRVRDAEGGVEDAA